MTYERDSRSVYSVRDFITSTRISGSNRIKLIWLYTIEFVELGRVSRARGQRVPNMVYARCTERMYYKIRGSAAAREHGSTFRNPASLNNNNVSVDDMSRLYGWSKTIISTSCKTSKKLITSTLQVYVMTVKARSLGKAEFQP